MPMTTKILAERATASSMLPSTRYTAPVAMRSRNIGSRRTSAAILKMDFGFEVGSSFGPSDWRRSAATASDNPCDSALRIGTVSGFILSNPSATSFARHRPLYRPVASKGSIMPKHDLVGRNFRRNRLAPDVLKYRRCRAVVFERESLALVIEHYLGIQRRFALAHSFGVHVDFDKGELIVGRSSGCSGFPSHCTGAKRTIRQKDD